MLIDLSKAAVIAWLIVLNGLFLLPSPVVSLPLVETQNSTGVLSISTVNVAGLKVLFSPLYLPVISCLPLSNNWETESVATPLFEPLSPTFIPFISNSIVLAEAIVFPTSSVK